MRVDMNDFVRVNIMSLYMRCLHKLKNQVGTFHRSSCIKCHPLYDDDGGRAKPLNVGNIWDKRATFRATK